MSASDGKKPRTKGPKLPKLPKGPKRPKGPITPGGGRFAATVPTTPTPGSHAPGPRTPRTPRTPMVPTSQSGTIPAAVVEPQPESDAIVVVSAALTPPSETSAPASPTPPAAAAPPAPAPPAPAPPAAPPTPSAPAPAPVQDDFAELEGDGVDDFAALFAEVMEEGEPAPVSATAHPEARGFVPAKAVEAPAVEWEEDSEWDDNPPIEDENEDEADDALLVGDPDAAEEAYDPERYEDQDAGVEEEVIEERKRNYLAVYTNEIKPMSVDDRVAAARHADAERLHAFCYDSTNPRVVQAIMENVNVGFTHARLIMGHHHSTAGLELVGRNATFLRDSRVQKALFKNAQATQGLLRRIVQHKPLQQVYTLSISRDITAKVKTAVRVLFRKKFQQSSPELCAALIIKTEARCLGLLAGVPLNAKTCAILCSRPIHSTIMIQNLARFPATLPRVLEHLFRQPSVKRNTNLKNMILRHPNAPSQLKRAGR